jgi:hypothetical protein
LEFTLARELPTEEKIETSYFSNSLESEWGIQEIGKRGIMKQSV